MRGASELNPDHADAHYNLGMALHELGQGVAAREHLENCVRLKPEFPDAQYCLGLAYFNEKRFDEAIAAYLEGIELRPDYAVRPADCGDKKRWLSSLGDPFRRSNS